MKRTGTVLAAALLAALTLGLSASESVAGDAQPASNGVVVVIEVWRTADPAVFQQIEGLTNKDPADADGVHQVVSATDKAARVSRFVTPTQFGTVMKHSDRAEKAVQMKPPTTGGRGGPTFGGFGGFSSEGTSVLVIAKDLGDGKLEMQVQVKVSIGGQPKRLADGSMMPPNKFHAEVDGTVAAPSGTNRMFVSHTTGSDKVIVFVKGTHL